MHARAIALLLGFGFLYLPMLSVVVYSFNESRLVTVWSGFSTHWYAELWRNDQLINALWLSLRIAAVNATLAVLLACSAALFLARVRRGFVRALVAGSLGALLVVPEIVLGFALLLTFVTLESVVGWPHGRGAGTVAIAHTTLSIAFATVIIRARLATLDRVLEEAAHDLGATPWRVLRRVTLPLLAPGLAAAWLLSFTLSLDDLVLASFTSGPDSTTLPMVVYSSVRLGVSPQVNALATVLMAAVAIGVSVAAWFIHRRRWAP